MSKFPFSIQNLINEFNKLPGIGPKTSERLVFSLLKRDPVELDKFAGALLAIKKSLNFCRVCGNISEKNPCAICSDPKRDHTTVCVVAEVFDLMAIENTGEYNGLYHVLGGCLNPLEGVAPEDIKIRELVERLKTKSIKEIILALNPDLEGEGTVMYLGKLLKPSKIKITRLARGLPMGSNLEYADEVTLLNALKGRGEI